MADTNQGVVYTGPGRVEVQDLDYPKLELPEQNNRPLQHGVILRVVATNICGSDQHMVRGRTTAPVGQTLGHEITGEVAEVGRDVEFVKQGDLVSVPFNIACGRCRNCKERNTGVCENVNPARAGAAYGYVDMGGWLGGQARYVTVPYADWNLLKFPDRDQAMAKIRDLAMLSDIFPTGYHGAFTAGVTTGSTVYIAGAGQEGSQGEAPATVLNTVMDITRAAGKLGIPGLYVTGDPGAVDEPAKVGSLSIRIGLGWAKSHALQTGQCPVMKYNRQLMMAILHDKVRIADNVNATVISLDEAPQGYQECDQGFGPGRVVDPDPVGDPAGHQLLHGPGQVGEVDAVHGRAEADRPVQEGDRLVRVLGGQPVDQVQLGADGPARPGRRRLHYLDDPLGRADLVGLGDNFVAALGVDQHAHAGDALAHPVDVLGQEAVVDRAVPAPQHHLGRPDPVGVEAALVAVGGPHHAVGRLQAHGPGGVAAQGLVGQEQHPLGPLERPGHRLGRVGGGADGAALAAGEGLDRGRGVHVGQGHGPAR